MKTFEEYYKQACVEHKVQPSSGVLQGWRDMEVNLDLNGMGAGMMCSLGEAFKKAGRYDAGKIRVHRSKGRRDKTDGGVVKREGGASFVGLLGAMTCAFNSHLLTEVYFEDVSLGNCVGGVKKALSCATQIRILALKKCRVGDSAFLELQPVLKKLVHVTQLDLSGNLLSDKSADGIRGIVQRHQERRQTEAFHAQLRSGEPLRLEGLRCTGLVHLDLSGNMLSDVFCKLIASVLHNDVWVASLCLSSNKIGAKGLLILNKLLTQNRYLTFVDLSHNEPISTYLKTQPLHPDLLFASSSPQSCIYTTRPALQAPPLPSHPPPPPPPDRESSSDKPDREESIEKDSTPSGVDRGQLIELLQRARGLPHDMFDVFVKSIDAGPPTLTIPTTLETLQKIERTPQKVSTGTSPRPSCGPHHLCCPQYHQYVYHPQRVGVAQPVQRAVDKKVKAEQERMMNRELQEHEKQVKVPRGVDKDEARKHEQMLLAILYEDKMAQNIMLADKVDKLYEELVLNRRTQQPPPRQASDERTASPPRGHSTPPPRQPGYTSDTETDLSDRTEPPDMSKVHERLFTKYDCYS